MKAGSLIYYSQNAVRRTKCAFCQEVMTVIFIHCIVNVHPVLRLPKADRLTNLVISDDFFTSLGMEKRGDEHLGKCSSQKLCYRDSSRIPGR